MDLGKTIRTVFPTGTKRLQRQRSHWQVNEREKTSNEKLDDESWAPTNHIYLGGSLNAPGEKLDLVFSVQLNSRTMIIQKPYHR